MKIVINGQEIITEETKLKAVLDSYGFSFPCGGQGKCGKCRIQCAELPVTALDRRFLTENAIEDGWRIACDKETAEVTIACPPPTRMLVRRDLSCCNVTARIGHREIEVAICDDEVAEMVRVPNPLYGEKGIEDLVARYEADPEGCATKLRSAIGKESVELFEAYGKAKAETTAIATCGLYAKILLGLPLDEEVGEYNDRVGENVLHLPTETVYFLPIKDEYVGGDIFAETVKYAENTLVVDCDEVLTLLMIDKENTTAASMWGMRYDEMGLRALKAGIRTLIPDGYTPLVKLMGPYRESAFDALVDLDLTVSFDDKDIRNEAKVLAGLRYRTKLQKEKTRTTAINLLQQERFHAFFAQE